MKVSIIIPVYNEEKTIESCLQSLSKQTTKGEIIVVDDGSTDNSKSVVSSQKSVVLLQQNHQGPGAARNLGASKASGGILVFVDADMEFEPDFIEKLVAPILASQEQLLRDQILGTFSKEEYLLNKDNVLARCWNLNLGHQATKMHPDDYPDTQPVFRAILKEEFDKVRGFDTRVGYTDDWSLSRKLGVMATVAPGAKYYHRNPETFSEVWRQARWFGKNEFLTGNLVRKFYNFLRYFPLLAAVKGVLGAVKFNESKFLPFKIVFDTAVFVSVCQSFVSQKKYK